MTNSEGAPPSADGAVSAKGLATGAVGTFSGGDPRNLLRSTGLHADGQHRTDRRGRRVEDARHLHRRVRSHVPHGVRYRELNSESPDCGASFTWSTKAFGPYVGWMCGWGMVIATIIVLSNLAAIAVQFFYLFIAKLFDAPSIADLPGNKFVNVGTTLLFIALATWIASRGITTSEKLQFALVGFQMVLLIAFAVVALVHVGNGSAPAGLSFDLSWFNRSRDWPSVRS